MLDTLSRTVVVTGHYGSGKTNLSLNMALALRAAGRAVTLVDLDVVNPYFRSADFRAVAAGHGVHLIAPSYAGTSVDIPSLTGELDARLGGEDTVIIDAGGDDDGAHALGRYAPRILEGPYDMLFVVSFFRYLTRAPGEAAAVLRAIEAASRLKATAIVNNSNLSVQTTREDIAASIKKAEELAAMTGVPLAFTAAHRGLAGELGDMRNILPVDVFVKTPWADSQ